MENYANNPEIPIGLGMALAMNREAMNSFASMPAQQQQQIIEQTHSIRSKEEMRAFVQSLVQ